MFVTQGVALGYDRSRLQRSWIESISAIQGVALRSPSEAVGIPEKSGSS
jgi:hypothetical protein